MPKRSIADFFKPFAFAQHSQSVLADDEAENPKPSQRLRSVTPPSHIHSGAEQAETSNSANVLPEASSQSSILSSLRGSTPIAPEESFDRPLELPTVPYCDIASGQSLGASFSGSQAAVIPSSQRVIRNGKVIIKDSDDERSGSDASLEDLDDLITPRKPSPISPPSSQIDFPSHQPSGAGPPTGIKTTKKRGTGTWHAATDDRSSTGTKLPTYKFSLDALIKQTQKYENSQESIHDARQLLESLEGQKPIGKAISITGLDKDLLAAVIKKNDDETDMGRLMAAIERTEALHQDETWSFFVGNDHIAEVQPEECPSVADQHWQSVLGGSSALPFYLECITDVPKIPLLASKHFLADMSENAPLSGDSLMHCWPGFLMQVSLAPLH
ncbi:MAG: hypothetical protein Q9172_006338 [Xanthocarpia lactea]